MTHPQKTKQWTCSEVLRPADGQGLIASRAGAGFLIRKIGHATFEEHDPGDEHRDPMITTTECEVREGPITPPPGSTGTPQRWLVIGSGASR